jgi:hypothetical protein
MSRLEHVEGARWARQTVQEIGLLMVRGKRKGLDEIIDVLKRGTIQKPADYANGVLGVIQILEDAK